MISKRSRIRANLSKLSDNALLYYKDRLIRMVKYTNTLIISETTGETAHLPSVLVYVNDELKTRGFEIKQGKPKK